MAGLFPAQRALGLAHSWGCEEMCARPTGRGPRQSKLASIHGKGHFPNEEHHVTGESAVSSDVAYSQKRECDLRKTKLCKGLFRRKV